MVCRHRTAALALSLSLVVLSPYLWGLHSNCTPSVQLLLLLLLLHFRETSDGESMLCTVFSGLLLLFPVVVVPKRFSILHSPSRHIFRYLFLSPDGGIAMSCAYLIRRNKQQPAATARINHTAYLSFLAGFFVIAHKGRSLTCLLEIVAGMGTIGKIRSSSRCCRFV